MSRKTITVVFCDMVGSTALSERLDAEALRHVMLRYYDLLRSCLERHGGTVEKFIGDAVMAVFGIPVVHEDDALRAARAALEMLAAVEGAGEELERETGARIAVRIGIHTGEVVTSGAADAGHALVSGEAVNVAARLEQHAPAGQILIGADTHGLIAAHAETAEVEPLTVRGKSEPVPAWRLTGIRPLTRTLGGPPGVPMVDRSDELAQLRMAFARVARDRSCHLVTLFGDPGVGKSRLARAFAAEAERDGALVAGAHCPPYGSAGPLAPLAPLLTQALGANPRARLAEVLGGGVAERDAATALARLARTGVSGTSFDETRWALQLLCTALAGTRPLVAVVDDLHWAHEDLLGALDHLADWVQGAPVLLLCVARPELLERNPQWGSGKLNATALVVPPLAADDCRELVLRLYEPDGAHDPEVVPHMAAAAHERIVERLVHRSEGNPLFVEQIVGMVSESDDPRFVPPSVRAVVAARLDRLEPAERAVLECAAVTGAEFTAADLTALLPAGDGPVEHAVRTLVRRRLLEAAGAPAPAEPGAARWRFVSQLIRDEVYSGMSKLVRARQHERFAEHRAAHAPGEQTQEETQEQNQERTEETGERTGEHSDHHTIGTHLEEAFRLRLDLGPADATARSTGARAARHLAAAGTAALGRGDVHWAVGLLRRALALTDALPEPRPHTGLAVRTALAEARLAAGDAAEAVGALRRLLTDARVAGDRGVEARVRLQLAYLEPGADGFGTVLDAARDAVGVFTASDDALGLARAWLAIGQERQSRSRHGEAARYLTRALHESVRAGAGLERAGILGALAVSLWLGPEPAPVALRRCAGSLDDLLAARRMARATVSCPMAALLAMRGEHTEARRLLADAVRTLGDLGHLFAVPAVHLFQATVEESAGCWDEAIRLLRAARAELERLGDGQLHATATRDLARVLLSRGSAEDEVARLVGGLLDTDLDALPAAAADVHGIRARLAAADGDADTTAHHLAAALDAARGTDSPVCLAGAAFDRARAAAALGRAPEAVAAAAEARRHFTAKGHLVGAERAAAFAAALGGGAG
ncbi:adenylate/guanylate cyclase domain-containing protein [Streptomyces sp. NBRC 110028]|uniref:adenylate/guanylate cyclase domain-containing protein n=1 Tax=Streptomyces sp. NBRC 110028 TaxID=1621260 RepID=UPI000AE182B5|nr:adenylate/guanylate cyclase domain-containing protein [Streptomyces sp. NBRC 110028]